MTRKEEFQEILQRTKEEARRELLASLPLKEWWNIVKETVVRPVFTDAHAALESSGYPTGELLDTNGKGVGLLLQGGSPSLKLELRLEDEIKVLSTAKSIPPAVWNDRAYVTEDNVKEQVGLLLREIAKQPAISLT